MLKSQIARKAKKGILKGKNQRSCSKFACAVIIGGIRAWESISESEYPVLLPLKWTVIHKRCGHGTPRVRPTRSAKIRLNKQVRLKSKAE